MVWKVHDEQYGFVSRLTPEYLPIKWEQDISFPAETSYDNYLVAILDARNGTQYNFILADG